MGPFFLYLQINLQGLHLRLNHLKAKMNKTEKIASFNPNDPATDEANIFGLPFTQDECSTIVLPLPWEVTVSYHAGTASAPSKIFQASKQVDLYDPTVPDAWHAGIYMDSINPAWKEKSMEMRNSAVQIISLLTGSVNENTEKEIEVLTEKVNDASVWFNKEVKERSLFWLKKNYLLAGLGGDHSTPLGIMQALADMYDSFAVLQLDAHCDLRYAYEGFEYSHASIMYNALKIPQISKLVQVGIRDYCQEEVDYINSSQNRVKVFFDEDLKKQLYEGKSWSNLVDEIVSELPENVYLSFDIDALDPKLCPGTGTPVAGGLESTQVLYLLQKLVQSGRKIISFDLNETGNSEWDANVSARLLYRICNLMAFSAKKI